MLNELVHVPPANPAKFSLSILLNTELVHIRFVGVAVMLPRLPARDGFRHHQYDPVLSSQNVSWMCCMRLLSEALTPSTGLAMPYKLAWKKNITRYFRRFSGL